MLKITSKQSLYKNDYATDSFIAGATLKEQYRKMDSIFIVLLMSAVGMGGYSDGSSITQNKTSAKDMYVVRATVYQVGILTNKTKNSTDLESGHQEAITFYRNNGSGIDMSAISHPLLTNVTAENVVGVAPVANVSKPALPWSTLKDFTSLPVQGADQTEKVFKRDVVKTTGKIEKGAALIPRETGVQSIALPPLLTLNNNMSKIPVPIPNVSVVSYAKVNTLVHTP